MSPLGTACVCRWMSVYASVYASAMAVYASMTGLAAEKTQVSTVMNTKGIVY